MNIFSGKRYFNDILWAPAYNNNTLPDTGISSNKKKELNIYTRILDIMKL
jgi:hypothetical protein